MTHRPSWSSSGAPPSPGWATPTSCSASSSTPYPRRSCASAPRTPGPGRCRRRLGTGSQAVVETTGAIDRLEIEAAGLVFTGRACGPHEGRRVLLLHGFPQTSWAWRDELWALGSAGFRAVAPDQRGYCPGARPAEVGDYATAHLVGDVMALADSMEMETFDLVGHDWGGMLAWIVASRHPGRLRSLTVVSTPHPLALQPRCGAAIRPRRPRARRRRRSAPRGRPNACSSAPTAPAAGWPPCWPRPGSTTRMPGSTWLRAGAGRADRRAELVPGDGRRRAR